MTAGELHEWRLRYDEAPVGPREVEDESARWARCYASDLSRAQATARAIWSGEIVTLSELREVEFAPFATGGLRLPVWLWRRVVQLAWLTGHASQQALRDDFRNRVRGMADRIEAGGEDVLLVSHAGMMLFLSQELKRRGFQGPKLGVAEHARVYVFERGG
jgi:broad specificity phosphatase PhoE